MSTTEQKALELADRLTANAEIDAAEGGNPIVIKLELDAAAELRRLSAENEALKTQVENLRMHIHTCGPNCTKAGCVNGRLRDENEALRAQVDRLNIDICRMSEVLAHNSKLRAQAEALTEPVGRVRKALADRKINTAVDEPELLRTAANIIAEDGGVIRHKAWQVEALTSESNSRLTSISKLRARVEALKKVAEQVPWITGDWTEATPQALTRPASTIAQEAHGYVREGQTAWDRENLHDGIDRLATLASGQSAAPALTRPAVPEFTGIAQRKLDELVADGFQVTGYAIQRDSTRGFIDSAGFVGWWTRPAVPEGYEAKMRYDLLYEFADTHKVPYNELCRLVRGATSHLAAAPQPSQQAINLAVIRKWPEGFEERLQDVWLDVTGSIPNVKLFDLQRLLALFGFTMTVTEATPQPSQQDADEDDSLLLCVSDLQHSAIYDNHREMQECIRAVADRITRLAVAGPSCAYPALTSVEVRDLTCMHAGAPWADAQLEALVEIIAIYEQLRREGKRPVDPSTLPEDQVRFPYVATQPTEAVQKGGE